MKLKFIAILLLQTLAFTAFTQTQTLTGIIVDEEEGIAMSNAHIVLKSTAVLETTLTNEDGVFEIQNVPSGIYVLNISYIGYITKSKEIIVQNKTLNLGIIELKKGVYLHEIQVVEEVLPVLQQGDTTQFNADAYKTMPDADAADLVKKMPTVIIEDGTIQAQGEDVKEVLVDGRAFFGNDPMAALNNLPAEVVDKIQVFDKQSDQAQFTGFDDGESTKTINIVTKKNMRSSQFGKIYAGYGYEDKYQAGGNFNIFNGDQRTSIIGLSNNVNIQNFSTDDILGVVGSTSRGPGGGMRGGGKPPGGGGGPPGRKQSGASVSDFLVSQQGGITSSNAFGINFSDKWGEKIDVNLSYFFNQSNNNTNQSLSQQYFDTEGLSELYLEETTSESTNMNHRFSGIFDYKINKKNSVIWRSSLSWQGNEGVETTVAETLLDSLSYNNSYSDYDADLEAFNVSNSILWRHKLNIEGRTISVKVESDLAPKYGDAYLLSNVFTSTDSTYLDQQASMDYGEWSLMADVQYTEPVGNNNRLMFNYKVNYQEEDSPYETYDFDEMSQGYTSYNESLSNVFNDNYLQQSVGGGFHMKKGNWRLMTRASLQWSELLTEQTAPYKANTSNQFWNFLPMLMISNHPRSTRHFRVDYHSRTQLPSIDQLQNVIDNSNPLQLTTGNPDLLQSFEHEFVGIYSKTNTEKSSVFFAMARANFTNNYISSNTYYSASDFDTSLDSDVQISVPVNLDGYYSLNSFVTYGFPISKIHSNLNLDFTVNHTHTPGQVDEILNYADNSNVGLGLTLSSNISENVDFTLSSRSYYNIISNSLQTSGNSNYLNQKTKLKFDWIVFKDFIFRNELTHEYYDGLDESYDSNYLIWNLSLGKKLFKDNRGEISLAVFDMLNQNTSLSRNVYESYVEDIQTNVLQRYVMLSMKYDIRHFRVK